MFKKTKLDSVVTVDSVITFHYHHYKRNFIFPGEAHDFWEMVYVDYGDVLVGTDTKSFPLKEGEAYFHPPMEYHTIQANDNYANVVIITFETQSPYLQSLVGQIWQLQKLEKKLISEIFAEVVQTFAEPLDIVEQTALIKRADVPFGAEQMIKTYLEQLLIALIRHASQTQSVVAKEQGIVPEEERITARVMEILEQNLTTNLTLDQISEQTSFSVSYLKRLFKKTTGYGIHQMFIYMKISKAKRLLSEEDNTVSEISDLLGFNSVHHFSKVFKQHVGIPPSSYAKSIRKRALL